MRLHTKKFPPGYVDDVFAIWYDAGKPVATQLYNIIPEYALLKETPTKHVLREWMKNAVWIEKAKQLDEKSDLRFDERHILSRVEMLERHAEVGREMQIISLKWLRDNKEDLSPGTAVRMLVDGIDIEQATAGIPEALRKMRDMKDEDLADEIKEILANTPVDADNR